MIGGARIARPRRFVPPPSLECLGEHVISVCRRDGRLARALLRAANVELAAVRIERGRDRLGPLLEAVAIFRELARRAE